MILEGGDEICRVVDDLVNYVPMFFLPDLGVGLVFYILEADKKCMLGSSEAT